VFGNNNDLVFLSKKTAERGKEEKMKTVKMAGWGLLVILLALICVSCATRIKTPGMEVKTNDPRVAKEMVQSRGEQGALMEQDYSHGVLPACAEAIRANPSGIVEFTPDGGCRFVGNPGEYNKPLQGVIENHFNYPVRVEITPQGQRTPTTILRIGPREAARVAVFPEVEYYLRVYNMQTGASVATVTRKYSRTRQDAHSDFLNEWVDFVERIRPK